MKRLLVVEDEAINRRTVERMLQHFGDTETAATGEEALSAYRAAVAERRPYDLICLDIRLPGMDGMEVLKEIRRLEFEAGVAPKGEVKVLMISTLGSPHDVVEAYYRGGCNGYLVKPLDAVKLKRFLKEFRII